METAPPAMPPVRLGMKLLFGLGTGAYGTKDLGLALFLLIYYNQVIGLPASYVSFAIMIALLIDAVADPIIGSFSDNFRSRLGRRHPFMYASAIPSGVLFFMLWNPPHWSNEALFFYVLATTILTRLCLSFYEIPSTALVPELSPNYDQRTSLLSYRWFFGAVIGGIVTILAFAVFLKPTLAHPAGVLNRSGYFGYSVMAGLVITACILISAAGTHSRIPYLRKLPASHRPSLMQLGRETFATMWHGSFLVITVSGLFSSMALGLNNALNTTYFGTYFWKFTPPQLSVLGLGGMIAAVIALFLTPPISKRFGKKRAVIVLAATSLVVNNLVITLKLLDMLPPSGSSALLLIFFVSFTVGISLAIGAAIVVSSMISDVVEDSELITGRRSEGVFSAAHLLIQKSISGVGIFLAGIMIDLVHFPDHANPTTIDPQIVRNLVLMFLPTQFLLYAIAIGLVGFYRIDRKRHESNLTRLSELAVQSGIPEAAEPPALG